MKFIKTELEGAYFIELEKTNDERGFFSVMWDKKKFQENNLNVNLTESNIAFTKNKGTIRGLHYQSSPYEGAKLVRCTKGKVWDVTLDLRPNSKTFKQWINIELSQDNYKLNYIPEGCAHGYQTMDDNCEVTYLMSQEYNLDCEKGVKYSDPTFKISFPYNVTKISEKDNSWEPFKI
jgi:dTDP-4-dehydrorhamnose 3,5-epimerase